MAVATRIKQGLRGLFAFMQTVDRDVLTRYLNEDQRALFNRLQHSEQLHAMNVLKTVLAQEADTPHDLAVAALLHDVGKIRYPLRIWQKTLVVLARRFLPGRYARWASSDESTRWKRPFIQAEQHPAWGAELAAQAGVNEQTRWLIRHHADKMDEHSAHPFVAFLHRLQAADDAN